MSKMQVSGQNSVDPITGIPVIQGAILVTQDGLVLVTQTTGEPPGGINTEPGTDPVAESAPGLSAPRLPYGFAAVPKTGPL
jgi:hypothetical protein